MSNSFRGLGIAFALILFSFLAAPWRLAVEPAVAGECAAAVAGGAVSRIDDWKALHAYFRSFRGCDEGKYGDLVSAAVVNLMTAHWSDIESGASQMLKDPQFSQFVLSHIDATAGRDDLKKIVGNASRKCPMMLMLLCLEIKQAAKAATK